LIFKVVSVPWDFLYLDTSFKNQRDARSLLYKNFGLEGISKHLFEVSFLFLNFPCFELTLPLGMHLKYKAVGGGDIKADMGDNSCMGTVKPFGNTEKGTEQPHAFYGFFT
jgi:hypothetical protein